jgi:hypothetical protein
VSAPGLSVTLVCPHCGKQSSVTVGAVATSPALSEQSLTTTPESAPAPSTKKIRVCGCGHSSDKHDLGIGACTHGHGTAFGGCTCEKFHSRRRGGAKHTANGASARVWAVDKERRIREEMIATGVDEPGATLSRGEWRILAAVSQAGELGRRNDALTAMVDYRATSLRTYLGNLRAAGYVETRAGVHVATDAGRARVADYPALPVGADLLEWWCSRLSGGERRILREVAGASDALSVSRLVGEGTTGLRETSVRTYLGTLSRRKLVRRAGGKVALAPILVGA